MQPHESVGDRRREGRRRAGTRGVDDWGGSGGVLPPGRGTAAGQWRGGGLSRAAGAREAVDGERLQAPTSRPRSCAAGLSRRRNAAVVHSLVTHSAAPVPPCGFVFVPFPPPARARRLPYGGRHVAAAKRADVPRSCGVPRAAAAPRPRRMHLPPRELGAPARASLSRRTDEFHGWTVTTERTMDGRCRRRLVNARSRRRRGQGGVEIFSNHKTTRSVLVCGGMGKGHTYGMVHRGGCRAQTTWFAAAPGVCRAERNQQSSLASASSAPCAPPMGGIVVAVVITHRLCPGRRRCSVAAGPPSVRCSQQLHDHWPCDVN